MRKKRNPLQKRIIYLLILMIIQVFAQPVPLHATTQSAEKSKEQLQREEQEKAIEDIMLQTEPVTVMAETAKKEIISVELPETIDFIFDLYEIEEKGQIYSPTYTVKNTSDIDIKVVFKEIQCYAKEKTELIFHDKPFDPYNTPSTQKDLYMYMHFLDNEEEEDRSFKEGDIILTDKEELPQREFILKAVQYDEHGTPLQEQTDNQVSFDFSGILNANSDTPWSNGDVIVKIVYAVIGADEELKEDIYNIQIEEQNHFTIKDMPVDIPKGESANFFIIPEENYNLPEEIVLYTEEGVLKPEEYIYNSETGEVTILDIQADITAKIVVYPKEDLLNPEEVSWSDGMLSWNTKSDIISYQIRIEKDNNIVTEEQIKNTDAMLSFDTNKYMQESGAYKIYLSENKENILEEERVWKLVKEVSYRKINYICNYITIPQVSLFEQNKPMELQLVAEEGYLLPPEIQVSNASKELSDKEYTYNAETGIIVIKTGQDSDITITADGIPEEQFIQPPTEQPEQTIEPIVKETPKPTNLPSHIPTQEPEFAASQMPTQTPTKIPEISNSQTPSETPTHIPTKTPEVPSQETIRPSQEPTMTPEIQLTQEPVESPEEQLEGIPQLEEELQSTEIPTIPLGNDIIQNTTNAAITIQEELFLE